MSLTIGLDAMGGDAAPEIVVDGAARALASHSDLAFLMFGDLARVEPLLGRHERLRAVTTLRHTPDAVAGDAKPSIALRQGRNPACAWRSTR